MLQIKSVSVSYKHIRVLKDVSLTLEPGEIVAVTGANGCGKTTLLRAVSGLIEKDGKVVTTFDKQEDTPVFGGFVETPKLWNHLTGKENAEFFLGKFYQSDIVERMFSEWNMESVMDTLVKKYSQGMKQKLALIISFASQSKILLFDEPTNALDIDSICLFCKYAEEASRKKRSVLIVTHDTYHLLSICAKVYFLQNGFLYENKNCEMNEKLIYIRFATLKDRNEAMQIMENKQKVCEVKDFSIAISNENRSVSEYIRLLDKYNIVEVGEYRNMESKVRRNTNG